MAAHDSAAEQRDTFVYPIDNDHDPDNGRLYLRDRFVFGRSKKDQLIEYSRGFDYKGDDRWKGWAKACRAEAAPNFQQAKGFMEALSILVDTSVWSLMLRRKSASDHPASLFLQACIRDQASLFLTGLVFQEILQGIRSRSQLKKIRGYLLDFPFLEATPTVHEKAAEIFNQSKKSGFNASTLDCLIAAVAIHHRCRLFTADSDFNELSKYSSLETIDY